MNTKFGKVLGTIFGKGKRKRSVTEKEVIEWFENLRKESALQGYDESAWNELIRSVSENSITWNNLLSFTREDLISLGIARTGPQRTLLDKIEELKRSNAEGDQGPCEFSPVVFNHIVHIKIFCHSHDLMPCALQYFAVGVIRLNFTCDLQGQVGNGMRSQTRHFHLSIQAACILKIGKIPSKSWWQFIKAIIIGLQEAEVNSL
jgi:hypothetical protein